MIKESVSRSLVKSVSYRILGSVITGTISFVLTGSTAIALIAGSADGAIKVFAYLAHERLWNKIHFGKQKINSGVIWLTGLPASGKTTLAKSLVQRLRDKGLAVEHLDGDEIRELFPLVGFDRLSRDQHIRRVGHLAERLQAHGVWVVVSLVSPYRESRDFVRNLCESGFTEVYLSTPLEECQKRDPKGLYSQARNGTIQNLTGVSSEYEAPLKAEVTIDTSKTQLNHSVELVLKAAFQR